VFSGAGPHLPDAACAPCNAYGRTKLAGEVAVRAHPRHVILRTSWLFCEHGPSFPRAIVRRAVRSAPLRVVDDQQGGPTPTSGLARGVLAVVDQLDDDPWGTWHCAGRPHTTWHGFAVALVEALGMPADAVERVSSTRFPRAATRPADSRLDVSAFEARFGMCVDWREGLGALVERLR
jgi:dTDP-4-dehydrorhamnose reductase